MLNRSNNSSNRNAIMVEMLDRFNAKIAKKQKSRWMKKNRVGRKLDRERIFHLTFSGSSNTVFMLDRFTPCFIQHFILMTLFRMLELRISNDSI